MDAVRSAALNAAAASAERSMVHPAPPDDSCVADAGCTAAQARELLRLLAAGQARLADGELEQAVGHLSGLLGHALEADASCQLAAQLRHV